MDAWTRFWAWVEAKIVMASRRRKRASTASRVRKQQGEQPTTTDCVTPDNSISAEALDRILRHK